MARKQKLQLRLIGLTGATGVGKTYIANCIRTVIRGEPFRLILMSEAIKQVCVALTGLPRSVMDEPPAQRDKRPTIFQWEHMDGELQTNFKRTKGPVTLRQLQQLIGFDVFRRNFAWNVWIHIWTNEVKRAIAYSEKAGHKYLYVVVPDVRFADELAALRAFGGVVWAIQDPDAKKTKAKHPTEQWHTKLERDEVFLNRRSTPHKTLLMCVRARLDACFDPGFPT